MTTHSRIDRLKEHLTPQQAVLCFFREAMGRFDSYTAWAERVFVRQGGIPLVSLVEAVSKGDRHSARPRRGDEDAEKEKDAAHEAVFLIRLLFHVTDVTERQLADLKSQETVNLQDVQLLLLRDLYLRAGAAAREFVESDAARTEERNEQAKALLKHFAVEGISTSAHASPDSLRAIRDRLLMHAVKAYLLRDVISVIRKNYFADTPVLFPAAVQRLERTVSNAEALAALFNEFVPALLRDERRDLDVPAPCESPEDDLQVNLAEAEKIAARSLRENAIFIVEFTRGAVLHEVKSEGRTGYSKMLRAYVRAFA